MAHRYNLRQNPPPTERNTNPTRRDTEDQDHTDTHTIQVPHTDTHTTQDDSLAGSVSSQEDMLSVSDDEHSPQTMEQVEDRREDATTNRRLEDGEDSKLDALLRMITEMKQDRNKDREEITCQIKGVKQDLGQKLEQDLGGVKQNLEGIKQELGQKMEQEVKKGVLQMSKKIEEVQVEVAGVKNRVTELEQASVEMKGHINTLARNTQEKLEEQKNEVVMEMKQVEGRIESKIKSLPTKDYVDEKVTQVRGLCAQELEEQRKETDEIKQRLEQRATDKGDSTDTGLRELISHCVLNKNMADSLPKFNGRNMHPMDYIDQMSRHYNKISNMSGRANIVDYLEMVEGTLTDAAANWFTIVKSTIHCREEFESRFLSQYWSRDVQKMTRQRIENERYIDGLRLSRTDHAIRNIITLQHLTPALQEDEIVQIIADQHNQPIRDRIRTQNFNNINALLELLNRIDAEDQHDRLRAVHRNDNERRLAEAPRNGTIHDGRHNRPFTNRGYYDNDRSGGGSAVREHRIDPQASATAPPGGRYANQAYSRHQPQLSPQNVNKNNGLPSDRRPYYREPRYDNRTPYTPKPTDNRDDKRNYNGHLKYPTNEQKRVCATLVNEKDVPEIPKERGDEKQTPVKNRPNHFLGGAQSRQDKQ